MSRLIWILVLVTALFSTGAVNGGAPATEAELKARFSQRHNPLQRLKDASKVGETTAGLVEVVDPSHEKDSVALPDERTMTVGAFIAAENNDRGALYKLISKRTGETVAVVAQQAAIRNFRQASPNHYLKLRDGRWVKKKDLPQPSARDGSGRRQRSWVLASQASTSASSSIPSTPSER